MGRSTDDVAPRARNQPEFRHRNPPVECTGCRIHRLVAICLVEPGLIVPDKVLMNSYNGAAILGISTDFSVSTAEFHRATPNPAFSDVLSWQRIVVRIHQ